MTAGSGVPPGIPAVQEAYFPFPAQQVEQFGRVLDPVKAAALHEAVRHIAHWGKPDGAWLEGQVIAVAERFEVWLSAEEGERP